MQNVMTCTHTQRNKTVSKHTDVDGVSQYTTLRGEDLFEYTQFF